MKYITILFLFLFQLNYGQCNIETKVKYYSNIESNFIGYSNTSVSFGKGSEISNSYNYIDFEQDALYCVIFRNNKKYYVKLFTSYNNIYQTNCASINSIFSNGYVKGKDKEGRIWKIYKKTNFSNGYNRPARKYIPPTSNINIGLIQRTLRKKQREIDRKREYLASLSYEEINALNKKIKYSRQKDYLYSKTLKRWIKADKKDKKRQKKLAKDIKKNTRKFNKSPSLNLLDIKNGWHKTIVNIKDNDGNNYVNRLVYFENGTITKYVGGSGFLSNIYAQSKTKPYEIKLKVGYEKNDPTVIYVSFLKNKVIKLKTEPIDPTIIKFYKTIRDEGMMTIYLNGKNYSNYYTLSKFFRKEQNITCKQTKGVVTFYVGKGDFEFYAHNSVNEWSGSINTTNRSCIIKHLSSN
ncbi:hypothetical protein [Tenacibaculum finnmarkense]|uniref:hypothetical protein n=1 Tax=Tenacibaculum finnmarkense TaxID=2781243 RepID=UPI003BB7BD7A